MQPDEPCRVLRAAVDRKAGGGYRVAIFKRFVNQHSARVAVLNDDYAEASTHVVKLTYLWKMKLPQRKVVRAQIQKVRIGVGEACALWPKSSGACGSVISAASQAGPSRSLFQSPTQRSEL